MVAKRRIIIFLLVMFLPVAAHAVSISAVVDKTSMTVDETLTLTVSVEDADAEVDISGLKDFSVVSRSTATSFKWINGKSSHEYIYTYILSPLRKGNLTIPPISMEYEGKTYRTEPISIVVTDTPAAGVQDRDIFVKARVSDTFPYVGQQIIYTFSLYYDSRIANPSLSLPEFEGFVAKQAGKDKEYTKIINGRRYKVFERKVILVPMKEGVVDIPPAVFTCDKVVEKKRKPFRDPFDSFFDSPFFNSPFFGAADLDHRILKTRSLSVKAVPLPENPHKVEFSGLVGSADLKGSIDKTDLSAGDSVTLTVTVEGKGNLSDIEAPKVELPQGIKVYPDNPQEDIKAGPDGYSGRKVFRFALVPVKEGIYEIPPVAFNYFDVKDGKYKVLRTPSFTLNVKPSGAVGQNGGAGGQTTGVEIPEETGPPVIKKRVEYTGHDILPLKESLDGVRNRRDIPFPVYLALLLFPALAAWLVRLIFKYRQRGKTQKEIMAERAKDALAGAAKRGIKEEQFLSLLYRALVSAVFAKGSDTGEALTAFEMRQLLSKAGVQEDLVRDAEALLDKIESARFGGRDAESLPREQMLEQTERIVRRLLK